MKTTVLEQAHKDQNARCAPFGEWLMPIQYEGIINEHEWTRNSCSIFDICHMGEFLIQASADDPGLNKALTQNLTKIKIGSCRYGFMLNEQAGIIDDVIIYRLGETNWMLVVNSATTDGDFAHLRHNLSAPAKIENISAHTGKIDVQGPLSREVLKSIVGHGIENLAYYTFARFPLLGEEAIISRTGYTGELGYEIYLDNSRIVEFWNKLLADKRVKPAGLGARDTLRLEAGYPLYGQDLSLEVTPKQAGMMNFVDLNKDFIGKTALLKQKEGTLKQKLAFFQTESRRAPRHGYKIFAADNTEIGIVTSGSFSPSLSCGIGMGYVNAEYICVGEEIVLRGKDTEIRAQITEKPFYKKSSLKS